MLVPHSAGLFDAAVMTLVSATSVFVDWPFSAGFIILCVSFTGDHCHKNKKGRNREYQQIARARAYICLFQQRSDGFGWCLLRGSVIGDSGLLALGKQVQVFGSQTSLVFFRYISHVSNVLS
jgi:hypothetical protein